MSMDSKCSVYEDLLPLYVEGLCSDDTKKEMEAHIKECKKCSEKLKLYRMEIQTENLESESKKNISEKTQDSEKTKLSAGDQKAVDSMKKVKKKLSARKLAAILLGIALIIVVGAVGVLYVGECTGESLNFTTIANLSTVRKISKDLCKGNVDTLIDYTYFDEKTIYINQVEDKNEIATQRQKDKVTQALEYYFHGEKFKYKIVGLEFMYDNDLKTGVSEYWNGDYMNPAAVIEVQYYNKDTSVNIHYYQRADRKFTYDDDIVGICENVPSFDSIEGDDTICYIISKAVERKYAEKKSPAGSLSLLFRYPVPAEEYSQWSGTIRGRVDALFEKGYTVSEMLYKTDSFDEEHHCLVYKCYFIIVNGAGEQLIMTQNFYYTEYDFYIIDGAPAQVVNVSDGFPKEMVEETLDLFAPAK